MQKEILDAHPRAQLRAYAIWFNMFPGDSRAKWPSSLLTDERVTHRWDEPKEVGRWFGERAGDMRPKLSEGSSWSGEILWDSYLLYGAAAQWDAVPTELIRWGRTIVAGRDALKSDTVALFGSSR